MGRANYSHILMVLEIHEMMEIIRWQEKTNQGQNGYYSIESKSLLK